MNAGMEIQIIAVIVSVACALPGVFLVLRKMSMMSDAITHTILLGIVLAFFVTNDLNSPLLILGAAVMGVVTVWLTEFLLKTRLVSEDSAIGLVFPMLFSIAIILISRYAGSVHLDTDSVLLGELAFTTFDRMIIFGVDIGAKAIYTSGGLLILNIAVIAIFYKELKLVTFDPLLAAVMGFSPAIIHYGLMTLISLTTVGAFQAVGSVLVVAFMIGPPVTAFLLTDDLRKMLALSAGIAAAASILGYQLAALLDASIAGSMASVIGLIFLAVFVLAPERGLVGVLLRKRRQRRKFDEFTLLMHICAHKNEEDEDILNSLSTKLHWSRKKLRSAIKPLREDGRLKEEDETLSITQKGKDAYEKYIQL